MGRTTTRIIVWSGGATLVAACVAAVLLTLVDADAVFAARLVAGLSGCL